MHETKYRLRRLIEWTFRGITRKRLLIGVLMLLGAWFFRYQLIAPTVAADPDRVTMYRLDRWTGKVYWFQGAYEFETDHSYSGHH